MDFRCPLISDPSSHYTKWPGWTSLHKTGAFSPDTARKRMVLVTEPSCWSISGHPASCLPLTSHHSELCTTWWKCPKNLGQHQVTLSQSHTFKRSHVSFGTHPQNPVQITSWTKNQPTFHLTTEELNGFFCRGKTTLRQVELPHHLEGSDWSDFVKRYGCTDYDKQTDKTPC